MTGPLIESLIILLLLTINGVLAMSEIAVVSARRARLQALADKGDAGARAALELAAQPSQFLSTIQIGITLIGILAGAFGGATLARTLAALLASVTPLAPYADAISVAVVVIIVTFLSLVIGELVPKRIALSNPERTAMLVAPLMQGLARLTAPLVHLLSATTELILRLLKVSHTGDQGVTEEEIRVVLDQAAKQGLVEPDEREIVKRVFQLGDIPVSALMTPRTEIAALDVSDSDEAVRRKLTEMNHSRFPVINGDIDNVIGIVRTKDLLSQVLAGKPIDLTSTVQPALFILESMTGQQLLEKFKEAGTHIALVIDEYGGVQGLVSINDVLEAIVGQMPSLDEPREAEIVQRADGSWLMDGRVPLHEFKGLLGVGPLPNEEDGYFSTLGGFVMAYLGRIPAVGDQFEWSGLRFEVVDMDGRRVDKVLIIQLNSSAPSDVE